jgi:hypothetical protein
MLSDRSTGAESHHERADDLCGKDAYCSLIAGTCVVTMIMIVVNSTVMIVPKKRTANRDNDSGDHNCEEYAHDPLLFALGFAVEPY